MFQEALQTIGDTLSAPRRFLWRSLGGPEHGSELVGSMTGLDPGGWPARLLGVGAEIAGDPLTYALPLAGGALAGALGAGAGEAATVTKALPGLASVGEAAAAEAAPTAAGAAGDLSSLLGLRRGFSGIRDVTPIMGPDLVEARAAAAAGQVPRRVAFFDPGESTGWAGKAVGTVPGQDPSDLLRRAMAGQDFTGTMGYFDTAANTAMNFRPQGQLDVLAGLKDTGNPEQLARATKMFAQAGNATRRHETIHGLINQAAQTGQREGLGPVAQLASWLKGPAVRDATAGLAESPHYTTFRTGAGEIADELAARMGSARGLGGQLREGAGFLFQSPEQLVYGSPGRDFYSNLFRNVNPWAGTLYDMLGISPYLAGLSVPGTAAATYLATGR